MILPCIDLMGGSAVQLVQGKKKALDAGDPLALLGKFDRFPCLQVIDLDAAMGQGSNDDLIAEIARRKKIRVGGGVRTILKARELIDLGVEKIIVGTAAFTADDVDAAFLSDMVHEIAKEKILVALDSKNGFVVVKGWRESLRITAEEAIRKLEPFCGGFLCTYVDKEGMLEGTDLEWFRKLRSITDLEITAAGGISTYEEIRALYAMNIHAALGMAVYTGRLDLEKLAEMQ
jgi:phosphoribosylformimino-5-aminoimidazole carboxamide ribotide isomerase